MRVMTDTNILISAALFRSESISFMLELMSKNHQPVLCEYIINEFYEVIERKTMKKNSLYKIDDLIAHYEIVPDCDINELNIPYIRDPDDLPILLSAMHNDIDILITGDKDFHALKNLITKPLIMTVREFLEFNFTQEEYI